MRSRNALLVLAALTLARTCVALQFQSVTPTFAYLQGMLPFDTAGFGLLLGLYMAPGALMSVASPLLARSFGNTASLAAALACMAIGQAGMIMAPAIGIAYLARVFAGVGGCLIYVLTIDLAAQLCDAGRRPGRMAAIAASWPFGNAVSLALLGGLAGSGRPLAAALAPAVLALLALVPLWWALKGAGAKPIAVVDAGTADGPGAKADWLACALRGWGSGIKSAFMPGMAFALYNVSFILFISFTPAMLIAQGYTPAAAANVAGLPMWVFICSVPCGGVLAGRWADKGIWLVALGCLGGSLCLVCSQLAPYTAVWYVAAGFLGGLPTGPMLAGTGRTGHKLFYPILFFIFFCTLLLFPPLVGLAVDLTGNTRSPILFCVTMLLAAFCFFSFAARAARRPRALRAWTP
jgi:MFS family permease